nr:hypothetical protein [Tanacetum cinerariifolium]
MAAAAQNTNKSTIMSIFHAEKLTGSNFTNWHCNLRIVLKYEKKQKFVEQPMAPLTKRQNVLCLMLSSMSLDLQRNLEKFNAYDMSKELKTMFEEQAKLEQSKAGKAFHACKQEDGQFVSSYLLKMKSYLDTLECLGYAMPNELGVNLILKSLNKDYDQFMQNYNMHSMGKMIAELYAKRRNDVKARTTLLLPLPDEHQLRFSKYETAKELWEAIPKTFGGNEATKKTKKNQLKQQYSNFKAEGLETLEQTFNRLQAIVSHLEFMNVEIKQDDLNQKFLTILASEWLMYTIV